MSRVSTTISKQSHSSLGKTSQKSASSLRKTSKQSEKGKGKKEDLEKEEVELKIDEQINTLESSNDAQSNLEACASLRTLVANATGVASIPISLRVLYFRYEKLKSIYNNKTNAQVKKWMAALISLVAMTHPPDSEGDLLRYYLESDLDPMKSYSIAYIREMAKDLIEQWKNMDSNKLLSKETLCKLILECSVYFVSQNSEVEACDLLMETEQLKDQVDVLKLNDDRCHKLCNYLVACLPYLLDTERDAALQCATSLCLKHNFVVEALYVCLFRPDSDHDIEKIVYHTCQDQYVRLQMLIILARHNRSINFRAMSQLERDLYGNKRLSAYYLGLARSLDLMAPKSPKEMLDTSKVSVTPSSQHVLHLGTSFLNAFANAGYGIDKVLSDVSSLAIIDKHEDSERMSATAAIGLVCLWDVEHGPSKMKRFLNSNDALVKAGSLLAYGTHCTSVLSHTDAAFEHLKAHVTHKDTNMSISSIVGLSIAYAGTNHSKSIDLIMKAMQKGWDNELVTIAAISCGVIASGSGDASVARKLVKCLSNPRLMLRDRMDVMLAIGLCFLTRSHRLTSAPVVEMMNELKERETIDKHDQLQAYIEMCAYAGSSNLLKIQEMVNVVAELEAHPRPSVANVLQRYRDLSGDELLKLLSVLSIATISLGEDDLGSDMLQRTLTRFLEHRSVVVKAAAILSLALTNVSTPKLPVIEILSKYSHSDEFDVALVSIFGLGLIGAGTRNTRIIVLLTKLTVFYAKQAEFQFAIRVAVGWLHLGKGILTLSPVMEMKLVRASSLTGLLVVLHQLIKPAYLIYGRHYFLYYLACTIQTKVFMTVDTGLGFKPVAVRVGQAIDIVGQVGNPRTVTGFQTLDTPVVLNRNEKAEMASDKFVPLSPILQGCVILKPNAGSNST